MTHIKPTPEAGLTAEDEALLRSHAAMPGYSMAKAVVAALDAARAETEAVRRAYRALESAAQGQGVLEDGGERARAALTPKEKPDGE